jgi:hypothetical protein
VTLYGHRPLTHLDEADASSFPPGPFTRDRKNTAVYDLRGVPHSGLVRSGVGQSGMAETGQKQLAVYTQLAKGLRRLEEGDGDPAQVGAGQSRKAVPTAIS